MQPATILAQDLQLDGILKELLAVHEWLNLGEDNRLRPSGQTQEYINAVENIQRWLDSSLSEQFNSRASIQVTATLLINYFASFTLQPAREADKFIFDQCIDNPLNIAIHSGHHRLVTALISAKAPINEAILQFAINNNNINLLNSIAEGIAALSSEDRVSFEQALAKVIAYNCQLRHRPNVLTTEMTQTMVNLLPGTMLPKLLARAALEAARVPRESVMIMAALLQHARMNLSFLIEINNDLTEYLVSSTSIFDYTKKCANQAMIKLIKDASIKQVYEALITASNNDPAVLAQGAEVTQSELAAYSLTRAQNLPWTNESAAVIREELTRLNNKQSPLRYFLTGYVTNTTLYKLIDDLTIELNKRVPPENKGTANKLTFTVVGLAPAPKPKTMAKAQIAALPPAEIEALLAKKEAGLELRAHVNRL